MNVILTQTILCNYSRTKILNYDLYFKNYCSSLQHRMTDILPFVEDSRPLNIETSSKGAKDSKDHAASNQDTQGNGEKNKVGEQKKDETKDNKSRENDTMSLSFDQVNDNADELIELRGEGRYFGVTDPESGTTINAKQSLGPLCANCHKRGHIRAKCKTVVCHKCGVVGEHYETQCPTTMVCSRCGQKGHIAMNCKNKAKKRQYCKHCDTFNHGDENCPSIWRSYITLQPPEDVDSTALPTIYCYNCASKEHYGDECSEQRTSKIPNQNGSAFSGTNLPRYLRSFYFRHLQSRGTSRAQTQLKSSKQNGYDNNIPNNKSTYGRNGQNYAKLVPTFGSHDTARVPPSYHNSYKNSYSNSYSNSYNDSHKNFKREPKMPSRSGVLPYNSLGSSQSLAHPTRSGFIDKNKKFKPKKSKESPGPSSVQNPTRSGFIKGRNLKSKKQNLQNLKVYY